MSESGHYFTRDMPMSDIQDGTQILPNMNNGKAFPKFFTRTVQDNALSAARGRFVPREIEMVRIIIPGDARNIVERRVKEMDKQRWPREYEAFRKVHDFVPDGTPLDSWPMVSRAQVEDLKYNNIFTVEQLAEVPDDLLSNLGIGAKTLRRHAETFLETARTGAAPAKLVQENEELKNKMALMSKQMDELLRRFEAVSKEAGNDTTDFQIETQEVKEAVKGKHKVPDDWRTMALPALREICRSISDTKVMNKQHAVEIIEEYLEAA